MEEKIPAGKFKAQCLKIMDRVKRTHRKIIVTKRNIPIVKLEPLENEKKAFGKLKGTIHFKGNIIDPIDEKWNAAS